MPLASGERFFRETLQRAKRQESLTTQYFIVWPAAFFRISSAVTIETPDLPGRRCPNIDAGGKLSGNDAVDPGVR